MSDYEILAYVALAIFLYSVIANRMVRLADTVRMDLAKRGEMLVKDERIPEELRDAIEYMMGRAYSTRIAWYFALTYFIGAAFAVVDRIRSRPEALSVVPDDLRSEVRHVFILGTLSVFSVSPLATLFLLAQILVSMAIFVPVVSALFRALRITSTMITGNRWGHHEHA